MASTKTDKSDKAEKAAKASKAAKGRASKPAAKEAKAKPAARSTKTKDKPAPRGRTRTPRTKPPEQLALADAGDAAFAETGAEIAGSSEAIELEGFAPVPDAEDVAATEATYADDDEDALHERVVAEQAEMAEADAETAPPLSPEEQELAAIYGDELAAAPAGAAHAEFTDRRTADEDRPMLPEINGRVERQKRWEERREARRQRRDQERSRRGDRQGPRPEGPRTDAPRTERPHGHDRPHDRPSDGARPESRGERPERAERPATDLAVRAPVAPVAPASAEPLDATGVVRVGNPLGDAAWQVFASIKGAQPVPVRQLAGMMRKRGLLEGDPEMVWPHLKAALLGDERSYKSVGLRPRIVYRGRDLFAPGPAAQSPTANAEADLARALSVMAVATHRTLKDKVATAAQAGFERLVHAYLVSVGFRDIEWIKRVEGISYAIALPPEGTSAVLISARSGDGPVDRRGVGELRVGVEAKQLLAGFLFAARELSPEAERELERNGRSITVIAGDAFVSALLASGVGVVTAAAPVRYVDDQLLGELLAGVSLDPPRWEWLGAIAHADAVARMEARREAILAGDPGAQVVWLAEHPPVITLGRSADRTHVVATAAELAAHGVTLAPASRGGDVTYHGPGQLMVYPVVKVRRGVVDFLATTAHVLAELATELGVPGASFRRDCAGLWLDGAKLAACGLHLRRQVAIHGWALNVATPPAMWRLIVPCGLASPVVSIDEVRARNQLPPAPPIATLAARLGPRLVDALLPITPPR